MTSYRLQGNKEQPAPPAPDGSPQKTHFGADHEIAILDYLQTLGVDNIYDWPQTEADADHGYSVLNYDRIDPKLGGEEGLRRKHEELGKRGMGLILDIVPNHMYVSHLNEMFYDVMKNGRDSQYAKVFEIDWDKSNGRFPIPTLGAQFGDVLEQGGFVVMKEPDGDFSVNYYDNKFPLNKAASDKIRQTVKDGNATEYFNAPEHWDELESLMETQAWRLTSWRFAFGEIAHRRFFDVNRLIGVRQEDPEVFALTHAPLAKWIKEGLIQGLRVDHVDGLAYPEKYLKDLRKLVDDNTPAGAPRVRIYVEKIHELTERGQQRLSGTATTDGTSGYEFMTAANNLYVNQASFDEIDDFYREFTGENRGYEDILHASKEKILEETFTSEMKTLGKLLEKIAGANRHTRDFTEHDMNRAIRSILINFDVYRTYNTHEDFCDEDRACLDHAIDAAKKSAAEHLVDPTAIDWVGRLLNGKLSNNAYKAVEPDMKDVIRKMQQLSGPLMAKAKEDTTFYIFNRMTALNEVGGDPGRYGMTPEDFHAEMKYWQENFPETMTALQTHDTKRGPDARLRILVAMTEYTKRWEDNVRHWSKINALSDDPRKTISRNDEYLLYQTLVATWPEDMKPDDPRLPAYTRKIVDYMDKATKEAKERVSWTAPTAYKDHVEQFVRHVLDPNESSAFLTSLNEFERNVAAAATAYSLGQVALQTVVPGEADIYQGSEFVDLDLVDPDNRHPVDFDARIKSLEELKARPAIDQVLRNHDQAKQAVLQRTLQFRRSNPDLLRQGSYAEIYADAAADRGRFTGVLREHDGAGVLVIAPRNVATKVKGWQLRALDLRNAFDNVSVHIPSLAGRTLTDTFTHRTLTVADDGRIDVRQLLETSPVGHWSFGDVKDENPIGPMKVPAGFAP